MQISKARLRHKTFLAGRARLYATLMAALAGSAQAVAQTTAAATTPTAPADSASSPIAVKKLPTVTTRTNKEQADPTRGYQPRTSSVASTTAQSLRDIPQAVAVVSGTVIEDQQARSLDDVLGNVSGVLQTNTLGGTRDAFIKRGFGSNDDGSILVDGLRSPVLHNYLATIDRVEVLKGPASLLYGIQEPGGVINLITRKPEDEFQGSVSATHTSRRGNGASFDLTGPIGQTGQVAGGTLAFRLIGEYDTRRYWRTFGRQRDALIAPALSWHDAKTSIDLSYQYVDYATPFDRGTVLVNGHLDDSLRYRRYEEAWSQNTGVQETLRAKIEHRLSDAWRLRATYGWARDRYDQYLSRARSFNSRTGAMTRSSDANLGRNDTDEIATIGVLGDVSIAGMRHELYAGAEYERQRSFRGDTIRGNAVSGFNLFNPIYGQLSAGGTPSASQSDSLSKIHTYSLVTQDSVHLTERLIAVGGMRWETYRQLSGMGRPFVVSDDSRGDVWLPQFGLVYKITPSLSVYANYSKSFVPNVSSSADQPLAPERGQVYEAGFKFDLKPGIAGTLAVYQIDKHDVAVTVGEVTSTIASARSRGIEFDVAGQLTRHVSLIANYAYTDAIDRQNHTQMANSARHSGSLFAVYDTTLPHINGRWRFGGGARLVGKRPGDTANSFTLPGYVVADAFVAYETKVGKLPTRVQLNVKNLFDKTYYPSSNNNLMIAVGEARLVTLTTTVSF